MEAANVVTIHKWQFTWAVRIVFPKGTIIIWTIHRFARRRRRYFYLRRRGSMIVEVIEKSGGKGRVNQFLWLLSIVNKLSTPARRVVYAQSSFPTRKQHPKWCNLIENDLNQRSLCSRDFRKRKKTRQPKNLISRNVLTASGEFNLPWQLRLANLVSWSWKRSWSGNGRCYCCVVVTQRMKNFYFSLTNELCQQ